MMCVFNHGLARFGSLTLPVREAGASRQLKKGRALAQTIRVIRGLILTMSSAAMVLSALAAEPTVSVTAQQRYPWNGLVDVAFTITGESGAKYDTSFTAKDVVGGTNFTMKTIYKSDGSSAALTNALTVGCYVWVWNAAADLPSGFSCERVAVDVNATAYQDLYMVIDLSGGSSATSYPVSYLDAVPNGGWTDEYKTTKLVLRRVGRGSYVHKAAGSSKYTFNDSTITLTKSFYIGVFEVTQKQYSQVVGANPSSQKGDMRPVENISYNIVRGTSLGSKWPESSTVDASSFLGIMRSRTKKNFDLPTQAQWEYACRAGTTTSYNDGGRAESNLRKLGRYAGDSSDGRGGCNSGHTIVGSYQCNGWGLYDMHGNVYEWCLDWAWGMGFDATDPLGPATDSSAVNRVRRGGSFACPASQCTSQWLDSNIHPSYTGSGSVDTGFRMCLLIEE